jgi:hypothetical protein
VKGVLHFGMQIEELEVLIDVGRPLSHQIRNLFDGRALLDKPTVRFRPREWIEIGALDILNQSDFDSRAFGIDFTYAHRNGRQPRASRRFESPSSREESSAGRDDERMQNSTRTNRRDESLKVGGLGISVRTDHN